MPDWKAYARRAARKYKVPENIFLAQIGAESDWNPNAVSPAGARGIAQIMPATARGWGVDPMDPEAALTAAAKNMGRYIQQYGVEGALRAYNAGPGAIERSKNFAETNAYVDKIMSAAKRTGRTGGSVPVARDTPRAPTQGAIQQQVMGFPAQNNFHKLAQMTPVGTPAPMPGQQQQQPNINQQMQQQLQQTLQKNWQMMGDLQNQMMAAKTAVRQGKNDVVTRANLGDEGKDAPRAVMAMFEEAERIDKAKLPYQWGGGHDRKRGPKDDLVPLDCSGAVSQVLGLDPRVSGAFENWGKPGKGKYVTVYANSEHVLMEINGRFWGTSKSNPGGGAGWIPSDKVTKDYLSRFTVRHPQGM